ncbi:MAG: serine protease [Verrucomicrobiota bacterium]
MRSPLPFATLIIALALPTLAKAEEPFYVDDETLMNIFVESLGGIAESDNPQNVNRLIRELQQQSRFTEEFVRPDPLEEKLTPAEIYRRSLLSTVVIGNVYKCDQCDDWHEGHASGVIISSEGHVLTNYHVLNDADARAIGAMTHDGRLFEVESVLASSHKNDVALVKLKDASGLNPVPLGPTAPVGEPVTVLSHPDGHLFTLTTGHVARYYVTGRNRAKRLQITAPFAKGSSGSGVYDQCGNLIGLVAATRSIYYNETKKVQKNFQMVVNICVPAESIAELLEGENQTSG